MCIKKLLLLPAMFFLINAKAQDTLDLIQRAAALIDLDFTTAEADSMQGNIFYYQSIYKAMHRQLPKNNLPFPFAFNPAPTGTVVPVNQQQINWNLPQHIALPKNKNDLAFYSISELASLVKSKKISSVELTKFFIERLKKWGDTLESVITITEELALKEAARADAEIRSGKYRGPLHGIPYGLKDLFAVKGYKTTWGTTC
nr:amidase [Flavisolibacter sp.]